MVVGRKVDRVRDVIYLLITVAFFAICVGLIKACDQVIGPDELDDLDGVSE